MEDIRIEMPEEITWEVLTEKLGYKATSMNTQTMLVNCWTGIGNTAVLKVNPNNEKEYLLVIPDKVYWSLYRLYYGWWRFIPNNLVKKYHVQRKIVYNETWYASIVSGLNKVEEARKRLDNAVKFYNEALDVYNESIDSDKYLEKRGIYCFKKDEKIVYIGSTIRSFRTRWEEHRKAFESKDSSMKLYQMEDWENLKFDIMYDLEELSKINWKLNFTERDLRMMEFILIQEYKPEYNVAGVDTSFII